MCTIVLMDPVSVAREIQHRLGDRVEHPGEVLAEIERLVAERPATARLRVAIELAMLRLADRSRVA